MIHTLYRTIYEHLRYVNMIQNFLPTIRFAYCTILTPMSRVRRYDTELFTYDTLLKLTG